MAEGAPARKDYSAEGVEAQSVGLCTPLQMQCLTMLIHVHVQDILILSSTDPLPRERTHTLITVIQLSGLKLYIDYSILWNIHS